METKMGRVLRELREAGKRVEAPGTPENKARAEELTKEIMLHCDAISEHVRKLIRAAVTAKVKAGYEVDLSLLQLWTESIVGTSVLNGAAIELPLLMDEGLISAEQGERTLN